MFKFPLFKNTGKIISDADIINLSNWKATGDRSAPQWAAYLNIHANGFVKKIKCHVKSKSDYYRFGFKLFRADGKLFGDESIQSRDSNFVIHIGKDFILEKLYITTYQNGIRQGSNIPANVKNSHEGYAVELFIDVQNFLHFYINQTEVLTKLINREVCEQIYMLAWGDGNKFKVKVKNIEIEMDNA